MSWTDLTERLALMLAWLAGVPVSTYLLIVVPVLLTVLAVVAKTSGRPDRTVTMLATVIGLGWSAQGMWDAAVHHFAVPQALASVLFFMFEAFTVGNMLRANRFRRDLARRPRYVQSVWGTALIMGGVVALAEGPAQAPLRFAVPLLVAWNWYLDLTADDDPAHRLATSWKWTPRRVGLALGLLIPGAQDATTIDRERVTRRLTRLRFLMRWGVPWAGMLARRRVRAARLALIADDALLADVDRRLARAAAVMSEVPEPVPTDTEAPPADPPASASVPPGTAPTEDRAAPPSPPRRRRPQQGQRIAVPTARVVDGVELSGADLRAHAVGRIKASVTEARPLGMQTDELAASYDPPLGRRTADGWAAEARRDLRGRANGRRPEIAATP